jgi:SAM-dependent methyltransferase
VGEKPYLRIVSHYESCLDEHGDTHLGVDWPMAADVPVRHRVMLDIILEPSSEVSVLDLGCGASGLYEYILEHDLRIAYTGVDISPKFVELSRSKFSGNTYHCLDILDDDARLPVFDYVVMNGVFTEKLDLTFEAMLEYVLAVVTKAFAHAEVGIAFNVMSAHVDWERDDLFHLPFDRLAAELTARLGRSFVFRSDYGLYEYTTYLYRS